MIDFLGIFRIPNTRGFCGSSNPHVERFANKPKRHVVYTQIVQLTYRVIVLESIKKNQQIILMFYVAEINRKNISLASQLLYQSLIYI